MKDTTNNIAIEVKNLSKVFKIYARPVDLVMEVITRKPIHSEYWALRDVSFEVLRGDCVGILGRNGAGKSTLLKILAGTLDKTQGEVKVHGCLSAILELGSGFNQEYTGRENIRMGGLCLGMSRQEIEAKTDWIIEFSELAGFIDRTFKTFSTGMQARLTFATAAALEPDILIVDEALAVGDAKFQLKCLTHIRELCARGTTVLLVSHNPNTITSVCNKAIFLEKGSIQDFGQPHVVTGNYIKFLYNFENSTKKMAATEASTDAEISVDSSSLSEDEKSGIPQASSTALASDTLGGQSNSGKLVKAKIQAVEIVNEAGNTVNNLIMGESYRLVMRVLFTQQVENIIVGFLIRNRLGVELFGTDTRYLGVDLPPSQVGSIYEYSLNIIMNIVNGPYFLTGAVSTWVEKKEFTLLDIRYDDFTFEVISSPKNCYETSVLNLNPVFSSRSINN